MRECRQLDSTVFGAALRDLGLFAINLISEMEAHGMNGIHRKLVTIQVKKSSQGEKKALYDGNQKLR